MRNGDKCAKFALQAQQIVVELKSRDLVERRESSSIIDLAQNERARWRRAHPPELARKSPAGRGSQRRQGLINRGLPSFRAKPRNRSGEYIVEDARPGIKVESGTQIDAR